MPSLNPLLSGLEELSTFLSNYNLSAISSDPLFKKAIASLYKKYHPLLTWHSNLSLRKPRHFRDTTSLAIFRQYLCEVTSDSCYSILVWSQGLYKPAHLLLRSAIENFIKCLGLYNGYPILNITSVYDLFDAVKVQPIVNKNRDTQKEFGLLRASYSNLCGYVHSANTSYMSMTTALGTLPKFDNSESSIYTTNANRVFSSFINYLAIMFTIELQRMHHEDSDLIYDALPKRIKSAM
ncbi:hypothetical protein C4544_04645 [candidate division WS5 bacterium]|uniref:Uncharacterized protein n=1 Tax=candidate division WS5 bacterium TaxID=2093353 RepID=A0A419DC82_9BACT|nr:MAG: hypothetical protein C4544_04645 [candidate division WS5 bacterium]